MAEGKKSFTAYCDWKETFNSLPDDKAGQLIKYLFAYVNDENPETDDILIKAVFAQIKATLKRDLKKWESKREQNKANALKRWDKNNANACERIKPNANDAVSDSVSDSVSEIIDKSITYEEKDFLKNWNESRGHYTEIKNGTSKLKQDELDLFIDIKNSFKKEDFHIALGGLFKQEKVPSSIMWARPKHFLQNIETYIDAANNNLYTLYK